MRLAMIVLAMAVSVPAAYAGPLSTPTAPPAVQVPRAANPLQSQKANKCPRAVSHYAGNSSLFRGAPLAPKKLAELPPAIGFMAVVRTVDGCDIPMTMTEYRTGRRP